MNNNLIVVSGRIGSGKSTFAKALGHQLQRPVFTASRLIHELRVGFEGPVSRATLQDIGWEYVSRDAERFAQDLPCQHW